MLTKAKFEELLALARQVQLSMLPGDLASVIDAPSLACSVRATSAPIRASTPSSSQSSRASAC